MRVLTSLAASAFLAVSLDASAVVFRFDASANQLSNTQWEYSQGGFQATVTSGNGKLFYNHVEDAIGVGTHSFNGAMADDETLSVSFDQPVIISRIFFRQWENPFIIPLDQVVFTGGGSSLTLTNSGSSGLLDSFSLPDIVLSDFLLEPNTHLTAVYLWGVEVEEVPLPAAAWLFGSALLGLGAAGRRRTGMGQQR